MALERIRLNWCNNTTFLLDNDRDYDSCIPRPPEQPIGSAKTDHQLDAHGVIGRCSLYATLFFSHAPDLHRNLETPLHDVPVSLPCYAHFLAAERTVR